MFSEVTVNTVKFQDMLNKVLKGAGCDRQSEITKNIGIKVNSDSSLSLMSTDRVSYLKITLPDVVTAKNGELFDYLIPIETFADVVKKITSPTITIRVENSGCKIIGNGSYMIDLIEVDGEFPAFPYPNVDEMEISPEGSWTVSPTTLSSIIKTNQVSLSTTTAIGSIMNYYIQSDGVYSTDSDTVTWNKQKLLDRPTLIPKRLMDILAMFPDKEITIRLYSDGYMLAESDTMMVVSKTVDNIDTFPISQLKGLLDPVRDNCYIINKSELIACLDRIGLFIQEYDEGAVYLTFGNSSLIVTNKKGTSSERIKYIESVSTDSNVVVLVSSSLLLKLLSSAITDTVNIYLDEIENSTMKIVGDTVIQGIALMED